MGASAERGASDSAGGGRVDARIRCMWSALYVARMLPWLVFLCCVAVQPRIIRPIRILRPCRAPPTNTPWNVSNYTRVREAWIDDIAFTLPFDVVLGGIPTAP